MYRVRKDIPMMQKMTAVWNRKLNARRMKSKELKMFSVFANNFLELTPDQMEEMTQIAKAAERQDVAMMGDFY